MLTCIARSKQPGDDSLSQPHAGSAATTTNHPSAAKQHQAIKSLTSQLKDMALKASGAYRHCNPCTVPTTTTTQSRLRNNWTASDAESERFRWSLRRTGSSSSITPRTWGKEMEARLKGISSSSGEGTPNSVNSSGRRVDPPIAFVKEKEPKEWVAQVEPGVLITLVSLPRGGNDLKRIRFRTYNPTVKFTPREEQSSKSPGEEHLCLVVVGADLIVSEPFSLSIVGRRLSPFLFQQKYMYFVAPKPDSPWLCHLM